MDSKHDYWITIMNYTELITETLQRLQRSHITMDSPGCWEGPGRQEDFNLSHIIMEKSHNWVNVHIPSNSCLNSSYKNHKCLPQVALEEKSEHHKSHQNSVWEHNECLRAKFHGYYTDAVVVLKYGPKW